MLVFVGAAAVASDQGLMVAAVAHGFIVMGIIYMYGDQSGAHINPAVTLGLLIGGHVDTMKAIAYWIAQFLGAILAAFLLSMLLGDGASLGETTGSMTLDNVWGAAVFEAVLTFLLVSAVYETAIYGKAGKLAGIVIGFTLIALITAGGTFTGASLNPARTLGPALVAGNMDYVLPYFVGTFGGGAVAGLAQIYIFKPA